MVNINDFKLFVEYISNKVQIGGSVSPSQFNMLAERAQMQKFEQDRSSFLQTGVSSYFLDFFLVNTTTGVPLTGTLPYPSDFLQTASIRKYYVPADGIGIEVPVELVTNKDLGEISASQLIIPTKEFPKYSEFGTEYRFLPKDIGIIALDYWRQPVRPIWGYTVVSSRPIYNSATSTNFEWDEYSFNAVAGMYLSLIGVNLKDQELSQFAEMYKAQTDSKL